MKNQKRTEDLAIDLEDLKIEEVEILAQEGSHGTPDFATSTGSSGSSGTNSCVIEKAG